MTTEIRIRRVYDSAAAADGVRVLVDRIWPHGLRKEAAHLDSWAKDVAPSTELRHWYGHDPAKFDEFRRRYTAELTGSAQREALGRLRAMATERPVTLLTATKDLRISQVAVLAQLLREACLTCAKGGMQAASFPRVTDLAAAGYEGGNVAAHHLGEAAGAVRPGGPVPGARLHERLGDARHVQHIQAGRDLAVGLGTLKQLEEEQPGCLVLARRASRQGPVLRPVTLEYGLDQQIRRVAPHGLLQGGQDGDDYLRQVIGPGDQVAAFP